MGGEIDQVRWRGVRPVEGISGIWPARNAVRVNKSVFRAGAASAIIYTVPAGKKCFITSLQQGSRMVSANSSYVDVIVRNEVDAEQYQISYMTFIVIGQQNLSRNFSPAIELDTGWDIILRNSHADLHSRAQANGWLEDE